MKRYIIILIVLLSLASCTKHSEHWETLAQVESYIEERPDSALVVLQGIDNEELFSSIKPPIYNFKNLQL